MARWHSRVLWAGVLGAALVAPGVAGSEGFPPLAPADVASAYDEYDVKAALLYKLAKFIEWPGEAFRGAQERHVYCVVGRGPMGPALERVLAGKTLGGRRIAVRKGLKTDEIDACQVVFVHGSDPRQIDGLGRRIGSRPILLVGEAICFTVRGGMINLVVEDERVRFEINPHRAAEAGLRINPNLLSLARIVESEEHCDEDAPAA